MGRRIDVSVVIPCHDMADTIDDQLEAVARQGFSGSWEVVVVDNRSSDDLEEVVGRYRTILPEMSLVRADAKVREGYARNVGAAAARGELILFCDADDVVGEGWMEALVGGLERSDIVTGPLDLTKLNPPWLVPARGAQTSGLQNRFGFLPHGTAGNLGVRRRVHEAIGGFDEDLPSLPDADYSWRAQMAGFRIEYVPDALVHYRLRSRFLDIYRQARAYATADVLLHLRYAQYGMPRLTVAGGTKGWARLLAAAPKVVTRSGRARFAWLAGYRAGRVRGGWTFRTLAF